MASYVTTTATSSPNFYINDSVLDSPRLNQAEKDIRDLKILNAELAIKLQKLTEDLERFQNKDALAALRAKVLSFQLA